MIGFFVNTLVLRSHINPQARFTDLLEHLKTTTWSAYEHQDLPFERLVEALQPVRDLSYNPLFQVKFRLENRPQQQLELPGLSFSPIPQSVFTAKLDLSVDLYETAAGLVGGFEYNRKLFEPETMERMAQHFQVLLEGIAADPQQRLCELPLLSEAERQQILVDWNATDRPYNQNQCFHQLFEAQVEKTPDAIALLFDNGDSDDPDAAERLTYAELNRRSNRLAHRLRALGVGPEVLVGICIPRSLSMVIALLAILKAGGAYLPLDAEYPPERLRYMLSDAQVGILLSETTVELSGLPDPIQRINLDRLALSDSSLNLAPKPPRPTPRPTPHPTPRSTKTR
ncbi:MAG: AMP-binding protein [Synechococcales cyanobacterium CRU_2_2]|nr:AMP-binding protein [Synechococcales cyanobacterium CRU_2_2]